ncbi:hypothetical protein N7495_009912, partial [Penicillium taxi]|uniref:uncharacterized protein n=1 Tax=Penicillium taxi TaxID=168475 RepID=UPI00254553B8
ADEALKGESSSTLGMGPPAPVGFFDSSLRDIRKRVYFQWARTVLLLCVFILSVLSIFWGSQYRAEANLPSLKIWVVDFDGTIAPFITDNVIVGPAVTNATQKLIDAPGDKVGWEIKSPADFDHDPLEVRQRIYDEKAYAAIIVSANATTLLREAISTGNSSYDPAGAIEAIIISARDETTYYNYILPGITSLHMTVMNSFGPSWVAELVKNSTDLSNVPPQAINPAIGMSTIDLRPFAPAITAPAVTIGLIYLIILAFFSFPFLMPVHVQLMKPDGHPPLKVAQWILWRICSSICAYFFMSLCYSFVSLAFQIPFNNHPQPSTVEANNPNAFGHGSFVVFWMLNWVGMAALGFPCENMAMVLGMPYSAMFLIFWVITNVATGFYSLDLAPGFYAWGYAWPLHRIVEALRTILFGTHSRIGLDFGILFAWIAVSLAFYPVATFIMQWKMKRGI